MDNKSEQKYVAPGTILPLQTSTYVDFKQTAIFARPNANIPFFAYFNQPTTTASASANAVSGSSIGGTSVGVVVGANQTIYTGTINKINVLLYGMQFSGDANGVFSFLVNGILKNRFTTNITNANIDYEFPLPLRT